MKKSYSPAFWFALILLFTISSSCADLEEEKALLTDVAVIQNCKELYYSEGFNNTGVFQRNYEFEYDVKNRLSTIHNLRINRLYLQNNYVNDNFIEAVENNDAFNESVFASLTSSVWRLQLDRFKLVKASRSLKRFNDNYNDTLAFELEYDGQNRLKALRSTQYLFQFNDMLRAPLIVRTAIAFTYNEGGALVGYRVNIDEENTSRRMVYEVSIQPTIQRFTFHRTFANLLLNRFVDPALLLNGPLLNLGNVLPGVVTVTDAVSGAVLSRNDYSLNFFSDNYAQFLNFNNRTVSAVCD